MNGGNQYDGENIQNFLSIKYNKCTDILLGTRQVEWVVFRYRLITFKQRPAFHSISPLELLDRSISFSLCGELITASEQVIFSPHPFAPAARSDTSLNLRKK